MTKANTDTPASVLSRAAPRPWRVQFDNDEADNFRKGRVFLEGKCGWSFDPIGIIDYSGDTETDEANAALIVCAVNSHDALIEAVTELLATHPAAYRAIDNRTDNAVRIARAAIAGAK